MDFGLWMLKFENGKLYGCGGVDDGYVIYVSFVVFGVFDE